MSALVEALLIAAVSVGAALGLQARWCRWFYRGEHHQ